MRPTRVFYENLKAFNDGYRLIANIGSARSSKSVSIEQCLYVIANESKKHRKASVVSQSFPHLQDGFVYDFERMLTREGINANRVHNKTGHEFRINSSIVNYFSADNTGKVLGPARTNLFCNELNKGFTFETFHQLRTRTEGVIWADWNPSSAFFAHTEGLLEDPRTKVIRSTFLDNPYLTKAQYQDFLDARRKAKFSEYWSYWWKVYGLGQEGILLEERIMPFIKWASKVPDDAEQIPSGLDFGFFPDPTAFCKLWLRKNNGLRDDLFIQQMIYDTKLSINTKAEGATNLVDELLRKGVNPLDRIIAECADPGALHELRLAGFSIEAVKKKTVEVSIRLFHDYNLYVLEDSNDVYNELDNYKYKRDPKGIILAIPAPGQSDHFCDAIRYVLSERNRRWHK